MGLFDEKTCADLAKTLTAMCVRNAEIENIHAGKPFVSRTDDHSDVKIIDADGNEFSWPEVSHISDTEMKILMKGVVNRLYTFLMQCDDPRFNRNMAYHKHFTRAWDEPQLFSNRLNPFRVFANSSPEMMDRFSSKLSLLELLEKLLACRRSYIQRVLCRNLQGRQTRSPPAALDLGNTRYALEPGSFAVVCQHASCRSWFWAPPVHRAGI